MTIKDGLKIGGIAVAAVLVVGGAIFGGQALGNATGLNRPAPTPTFAAVVETVQPGFANGPEKTPPPEPVVEAPVVEAPPVELAGPVLCPEGTTAQTVDDSGNESNCTDNGPGDQPCIAYDDANNCTAYYKP